MFNILLVDDEVLIRRGLKAIIHRNSSNFRVVCEAANGNEAIGLINKYKPDVVISDIKMPEKDGLELARDICEKYPHIITIILSGYDDFNYAKQAIKFKVYDYLLKPVETEELVGLLDKLYSEMETRLHDKKSKEFLNMHITGKISLLFAMVKQKDLILNIETMNRQMVGKVIDDIFEYMIDDKMDIFHVKQISLELLNIVLNDLASVSDNVREEFISDMCTQKNIENINSVEGIKIWFKQSVNAIIDYLKNRNSASQVKVIDKIKKYIKENYEKDISLNLLAEKFYLNPCYLSDLFKSETGQNFLEYLTSVRIEKSIELLKDSRLKIYNISKMVGYDSTNHYNRIFKKIIGITPGEYRKKMCI